MKKLHILALLTFILSVGVMTASKGSDHSKVVAKTELAQSPAIVISTPVDMVYIAQETGEVIPNLPPGEVAKVNKGFITQVFRPPVNDNKRFRVTNYSEHRSLILKA